MAFIEFHGTGNVESFISVQNVCTHIMFSFKKHHLIRGYGLIIRHLKINLQEQLQNIRKKTNKQQHTKSDEGSIRPVESGGSRQGAPAPKPAGQIERLLGKDGSFLLFVRIHSSPRRFLETLFPGHAGIRRSLGAHPTSYLNTSTGRRWRRAGASTAWAPNAPPHDSRVLIHCPGS